jgi:hypothetical protein
MTTPEDELGLRIARRLDPGLREIDQPTLTQLRLARERAVSKLKTRRSWIIAAAGASGAPDSVIRYFSARHLVPILMLVLALAGALYWQQQQQHDDVADIDAKLLSGELPIDAYLDKGLDSWLKRTSY